MLDHGGNLQDAVARYGRPRAQWLDLSTGINPHPYPAPMLPVDIWHRLPELNPSLTTAAQRYYRAEHLLPVAGSQAAIQALPRLRAQCNPGSRVIVAAPAYAEHAYHWEQAGHKLSRAAYEALADAVMECDVMVICNPNNPTGATVHPEHLLLWAERLSERGGWLIVDEAFADTMPELSIAQAVSRPGLIVLRSIGKFFGLAGVRLGFVAAEPLILKQLADLLGPWTVSSAAQEIGCAALQDIGWQKAMRAQLSAEGERLRELLRQHDIAATGTALYQWWHEPRAQEFHMHMAQQGIWVRLFAGSVPGIRVGLPADETGWQRLAQALGD